MYAFIMEQQLPVSLFPENLEYILPQYSINNGVSVAGSTT